MKAVVLHNYGPPDVLELREVEQPTPGDDEVLVRVCAATVTAADGMMRRGVPFYGRLVIGPLRPRRPIPGTGFAGEVVAVGGDVERFAPGDEVFGETGLRFGANAEYVCVPEEGLLAAKPDTLTHEEAAALCDGPLTALNFLKDVAGLRPGHRVLVNGASGSVGTSAVQVASHLGAEVTGVCSTANLDLVRSLGADRVIDYTREDFTADGQRYDVIFDTVGKTSFRRCRGSLTREGVYLSPVLGLRLLLWMLWTSRVGGKRARFSATGLRPVPELRTLLAELVEAVEARAVRPVIDRRYSLGRAADAHRYVETGHKRGNVVIVLEDGG